MRLSEVTRESKKMCARGSKDPGLAGAGAGLWVTGVAERPLREELCEGEARGETAGRQTAAGGAPAAARTRAPGRLTAKRGCVCDPGHLAYFHRSSASSSVKRATAACLPGCEGRVADV